MEGKIVGVQQPLYPYNLFLVEEWKVYIDTPSDHIVFFLFN